MVWVLPVKRITPEIRKRMREALEPYPIMFNGRLVVACACVAGGKKGGVNRENIEDVMMEFERYMDDAEYNLSGPGAGVRKSKEEWVEFRKSDDAKPIYQMTDWHNSRTTSKFLENMRERKHLMGGYIPQCTFSQQPCDVEGFGKGKKNVADEKVVLNHPHTAMYMHVHTQHTLTPHV